MAQLDGVVFLTDMLGGSPFRSACELADAQGDCEVLTGVNMQLAAEMMLERDGLSPMSFTRWRWHAANAAYEPGMSAAG